MDFGDAVRFRIFSDLLICKYLIIIIPTIYTFFFSKNFQCRFIYILGVALTNAYEKKPDFLVPIYLLVLNYTFEYKFTYCQTTFENINGF